MTIHETGPGQRYCTIDKRGHENGVWRFTHLGQESADRGRDVMIANKPRLSPRTVLSSLDRSRDLMVARYYRSRRGNNIGWHSWGPGPPHRHLEDANLSTTYNVILLNCPSAEPVSRCPYRYSITMTRPHLLASCDHRTESGEISSQEGRYLSAGESL